MIADDEDISRYCKFAYLDEDGAPSYGNFQLSEREIHSKLNQISVNWIGHDYFGHFEKLSDVISELDDIYYKKKFKNYSKGKIALLNVGECKNKVLAATNNTRQVSVSLFDPEDPNDPSHAHLGEIEPNDLEVLDALVSAVNQYFSVSN